MYIADIKGLRGGAAEQALQSVKAEYRQYCGRNLKLDIQRGRPCTEQLDLAAELLDWGGAPYVCEDGNDARNYGGGIEGTPEARGFFADIFGIKKQNVFVWGNSSLNIMYDLITKAMLCGVYGADKPWLDQSREAGSKLKFICPVPGYDRHFLITETLGFEMINVDMLGSGPDMDAVEKLVAGDAMIKGIWNIPRYNNPNGITYSDETVRRFASLKPKATDFRIFWDDAYFAHGLYGEPDELPNLLAEAEKHGNEDMVYMFASTSKITFAGAGITVYMASENNIRNTAKQFSVQAICPDKLNQLRHVRYMKNAEGLKAIMKRHAAIIRPKFRLVDKVLNEEFRNGNQGESRIGGGNGEQGGQGEQDAQGRQGMQGEQDTQGGQGGAAHDICEWSAPRGGYFINLDTPDNCAREALRLASEAGVRFTPAGAAFPYGHDPRDRNIRIAPTVPPLSELEPAIRILAACIKIAYLEQKLIL